MIVVLEGNDGAGKTEVGKRLAELMKAKLISFPDDTAYSGPLIRSYLRGEWQIQEAGLGREFIDQVQSQSFNSALTFQALHFVNRLERMAEIQQCAGAATLHVVLVRYWQSGWVYGQIDGLCRNWLRDMASGMAKADTNILLDVDAMTALVRQGNRAPGEKLECYEGSFLVATRVNDLYQTLWSDETLRQPFKRPQSPEYGWPVVDARQSLEKVIEDVKGVLPCPV